MHNCPWFFKCFVTFHVAKEEERVEVGTELGEDDDQDMVDATQVPPKSLEVPIVPMKKGGKCECKYGSNANTRET